MFEQEPIQAKGTLTVEEFQSYNFHHSKRLRAMYFVSVLVIFFFLFQTYVSGSFTIVVLITLIPSLVIAWGMSQFMKAVLKRKAKKEFESDARIQREITYEISQEGIRQLFNRADVWLEWNQIRSVFNYNGIYAFYYSKNKAIVLPERFFHTNDDIVKMKQIAREQLKDEKVKWIDGSST